MKLLKKLISTVFFVFEDMLNICISLLNGKRAIPGKRNLEPILLIGNGPSLKELDLLSFKGKCKFACVNFFPLQEQLFFELKPSFLCIIDPLFFDSVKDDSRVKKMIEILNRVSWKIVIITIQGNKFDINNTNIKYEYISCRSTKYDRNVIRRFILANNYSTTGLQNVMNGALYYFVMKNYQKIYLAGLDMSEFTAFSIDERNHVLLRIEHFYGEEFVDFTENGTIQKGDFHTWLGYYSKMLDQFYYTQKFAISKGVEVINFTTNSYVDVFEKRRWEDGIS